MPRQPRTKPVSAAQVRSYAAKAAEFAEAAASDLDAGRNIAATSLAIHAGINAADAVCGARLGQRAAGDDHDQVLTLLVQAGPDGTEIARDLPTPPAQDDGRVRPGRHRASRRDEGRRARPALLRRSQPRCLHHEVTLTGSEDRAGQPPRSGR